MIVTRNYVDEILAQYINSVHKKSNSPLNDAVSYALLGPGKRARGQFVLMSTVACSGKIDLAHRAAVAIEMIHAYSLVHDDLPCMDDDHLRRGRPTTHIKYGEALALLAGDALLTDAFRLLADETYSDFPTIDAATIAKSIKFLSAASGGSGMVEGQASDIYWSARSGASLSDLEFIHLNKTAKLLGASLALGAIAAKADDATIDLMQKIGTNTGLCFQIIDDLLDDESTTGKSSGKDKAQGKLTYVTLLGKEKARGLAEEFSSAAVSGLEQLGPQSLQLSNAIQELLHRKA